MRKFYLFALSVGFSLTVLSCSTSKKLANHSGNAIAESANSYDSLPYRAVPTEKWQLINTNINIHFNLPEKTAEATTILTLHPYFYPADSVILDAKSMKILSVSMQNDKNLSYQYNGKKLGIRLPETMFQNDTLHLSVHYIAMPYAKSDLSDIGGTAITENRGLYFINTDHFEPYQQEQIWTQGETEANSHWFPTFDHSNFRSTFEITMHVPDSFKTLSNGQLVKSVEEPDEMRADTWIQDKPIPPYLVMMAASNFAVVKDTPWKGKEVAYYVPQEYGKYAKDIFRYTPEMIDFFSKKLKMDFPWYKYDQVIGYDYVSGAMENVSASLFGAFNLKDSRQIADDNNDFIIAHELFHQWFGDYVTCENWSQITLNESFADFSEKLWAAYKYGEGQAEIQFYHSKLRYLGQAPQSDLPLVRFRYKDPDDVFDRVSYSKGGLILNYLRQLTGDSAFFNALHLYLTQNALQSAEADQLRHAFEKVTGKDWQWFFNQWYYKGGHPKLQVSYQYNDAARQMKVIVEQTQQAAPYQTKIYRLPLKAQIIRGSDLQTIDWLVDSQKQVFVYPYKGNQRPIFIPDAGHWLPGEIKDNKTQEQYAAQYFAGLNQIEVSELNREQIKLDKAFGFSVLRHLDLMSRHDALTGLVQTTTKTTTGLTDSVLKVATVKDTSSFIRSLALRLLIEFGDLPSNAQWKTFFFSVAQNDPDNKIKAEAISWLGRQKDKQYLAYFDHETNASSYYVATAALRALNELAHHHAEVLTRDLLNRNYFSAMWLTEAGNIIGQDGNPDDYSFFTNILWHKFEGDRAEFMTSFANYLLNVKSDSVYTKGLALIKKLADKEGAGSRFQLRMYAPVYSILYLQQEKAYKATADNNEKQQTGIKVAAAKALWLHYTSSVKDENTLQQIKGMESLSKS